MIENNNKCPHCGRDYEGKPYFCNFCGGPIFIGNSSRKENLSDCADTEDTKIADDTTIFSQEDTGKTTAKGNNSSTTRYSGKRLLVETDDATIERPSEQKKSSKWVVISLIWFFIIIIAAGVTLFFLYDKKFDDRKSALNQMKTDSINASIQAKLDKLKREKDLVDSLRNDEFMQIHKEDSIENIRKMEEWRQDSMLVDKNMSDFIHQLSGSKKILGR